MSDHEQTPTPGDGGAPQAAPAQAGSPETPDAAQAGQPPVGRRAAAAALGGVKLHQGGGAGARLGDAFRGKDRIHE